MNTTVFSEGYISSALMDTKGKFQTRKTKLLMATYLILKELEKL